VRAAMELQQSMNVAQGIGSVLIVAAAVAVPAALGYYYFATERRSAKATVTNALQSDIDRLRDVLDGHLRWIAKPEFPELPLVPFDTALYDSHLENEEPIEPSVICLSREVRAPATFKMAQATAPWINSARSTTAERCEVGLRITERTTVPS
jgi:hypothetical protein